MKLINKADKSIEAKNYFHCRTDYSGNSSLHSCIINENPDFTSIYRGSYKPPKTLTSPIMRSINPFEQINYFEIVNKRPKSSEQSGYIVNRIQFD